MPCPKGSDGGRLHAGHALEHDRDLTRLPLGDHRQAVFAREQHAPGAVNRGLDRIRVLGDDALSRVGQFEADLHLPALGGHGGLGQDRLDHHAGRGIDDPDLDRRIGRQRDALAVGHRASQHAVGGRCQRTPRHAPAVAGERGARRPTAPDMLSTQGPSLISRRKGEAAPAAVRGAS